MRNQQDGSGGLLQEALEPLDALDVEVVRRFVEQQQVRVAQQNLRQLHAHLPAAAELPHLAVHVFRGKAKSLEDALYLFLERGSADQVEPFVRVGQIFDEPRILHGFIVRPFTEFAGEFFDEPFEVLGLIERARSFLEDGGLLVVLHFLGQVADAVALRHGYGTFGGLLFSGDDAEQRGLARAVAPYEADAVALADEQVDPFKQGPGAEVDSECGEVEHCGRKGRSPEAYEKGRPTSGRPFLLQPRCNQ